MFWCGHRLTGVKSVTAAHFTGGDITRAETQSNLPVLVGALFLTIAPMFVSTAKLLRNSAGALRVHPGPRGRCGMRTSTKFIAISRSRSAAGWYTRWFGRTGACVIAWHDMCMHEDDDCGTLPGDTRRGGWQRQHKCCCSLHNMCFLGGVRQRRTGT